MTTTCLPDQTAVIRCITATNSGYVVGTSNGSVWQFLDNEWISRELPSARACDAVTVWRNKIYVADSDGVVWGLQANGEWQEEYRSPHPLHDFVASQEHLFVVGDSSTIAKTIDTQRGFDVVVPPDSIARFMCGVALGDEILLGADKGTMYRYHVGTSAWSSVRVFHRFYNRSVRANAPRDLQGHVRALTVTPSGEVLATGSWLVDVVQGSPTEIVASSLDSGRSWMGYKLGGFVRLEEQQLPYFPDAPYRDERGVHIVLTNNSVCTNIIIDSADKLLPPELWYAPLRYQFRDEEGGVVARVRNNVLATMTGNGGMLHVYRRLDPLNRGGNHQPIMLRTTVEHRGGQFREIQHDTMPWVSFGGVVQGTSAYHLTTGNVIVASDYPYERWDTISQQELPVFMVFPHPRGIVVTTIRMYQDAEEKTHPVSQILVVDRQGVVDTIYDEDTTAPSLVRHVYAFGDGEVLACRQSGTLGQSRFTMHHRQRSGQWLDMPDLPSDLTYASGSVTFRGRPVVYAWSQTGTGSGRRFLLYSLRLVNETDWESTPVTVESQSVGTQPLQSTVLYQFVTSAVDTVHVLHLNDETYISSHTLGRASRMSSTPGFGGYSISALFDDHQVVLCGDDELLGAFRYDTQTFVSGDSIDTQEGINRIDQLQCPSTLRGFDVLGRLVLEHVAYSQSEAQRILQGASATMLLNNGHEVRYLVVWR